jgi:putative pyruvate formate lyase activating enzyme
MDDHGIAQRGLLLRHLVMPRDAAGTHHIRQWVAQELGPDTYVNIMPQYFPAGRVTSKEYAEIARSISAGEFRAALALAHDAGLHRLDSRSAARSM